MARRTTLYFPLEGTLKKDIKAVLALSNEQGQPVIGKEQEWLDGVVKIVKGMRMSLTTDGKLQLGDLDDPKV